MSEIMMTMIVIKIMIIIVPVGNNDKYLCSNLNPMIVALSEYYAVINIIISP